MPGSPGAPSAAREGFGTAWQYASLASGSKGNCHAFSDGERTLLVDAGISMLQIRKRLELAGLDAERVGAVAISHEHSDHIAALPMILKRTQWSLLATSETRQALFSILGIEIPANRWIQLEPGKPTDWDGWRIHPFSIPHDAADPVAFRLEIGAWSAAVVTDLGFATALAENHCEDLQLLVLESNHDIEMLRDGNYPPALKARILSRVGHLSNEACAEMLSRVMSKRLRNVVLGHLSEANNDPELARATALATLAGSAIRLDIARQGEPLSIPVAI